MIKHIFGSNKYMNVTEGIVSNYINNYTGAQGVGNMRFNTVNQGIEVYDGQTWMPLQMSQVTVGLNVEAESLLDWAKQKRKEELELEAFAENNPTVRDLLNTIKQKQEQISIVRTLIKKEESVETR
jgi:hypothetical protein